MSITLAIWIGAGALATANLGVCISVVRSDWYSSSQKIVQCALIWLLPIIGVIVVWSLLHTHSEMERRDRAFQPQQDQGVSGPEFQHPNTPSMGES